MVILCITAKRQHWFKMLICFIQNTEQGSLSSEQEDFKILSKVKSSSLHQVKKTEGSTK